MPRSITSNYLKIIIICFNILWSSIIAASYFWGTGVEEDSVLKLAAKEAEASFNKDLVYRRWAAGHGGVYVWETKNTRPNPNLEAVPDRDIKTPSGRLLTLVNPAYMMRQVYDLARKQYGVQGHITSLTPIREGNEPDDWERKALAKFSYGVKEISSIVEMDGQPYLRYMQPLITEQRCLKCHEKQGYKPGDIRGGISTSVPLAEYNLIISQSKRKYFLMLFPIWLIGLLLFNLGAGFLKKQIRISENTKERYQAIFEHAGDYILILEQQNDAPPVIVDANAAALDKHGYDYDELIGRPITLLDRDRNPKSIAAKQKQITKGGVITFETVHYRKDGSTFPVEVSGKLVKNPADGKTLFISIERDISERKESEENMREIEERFRLSFYTSPDAVNLNRMDGTYIDINEGFSQVTGYSREDVIGKTSAEINIWEVPEDRKLLIEGLQRDGYVRNLESRFRLKDGSLKTALMSASIIKLKGEPHILSITRDITDIKKAQNDKYELEKQLQQAQKMESLGRLTGGVAHDFNNILGVIIGYTEMALESVPKEDTLHEDLEKIFDAATRSADIVRQLLAFSRQQAISPKILDLNEVVEGMLKMLRRLIGEDIELKWHPAAHLAPIKMDPAQLDQVLANLCINARDAIDGTGRITISTKMITIDEHLRDGNPDCYADTFVQLVINDDGCGIHPEHLEMIFEPFFTSKEIGRGTGLGLSTVFGIVKQNRGFIRVDSEPGLGSTFMIHIPCSAPDPRTIAEKPAMKTEAGKGETILVVEDDPAMLKMTIAMLGKLNYRVLTANSPSAAIRLGEDRSVDIDILLTDVIMPEMNGRDLGKKMTELRPDLKCLYMSGYTTDTISNRGILAEGINFIPKPFSKDSLAAKLREILNG